MPGAGLKKVAGFPVVGTPTPATPDPEHTGAETASLNVSADTNGQNDAGIPEVSMEQVNRFYKEVRVSSSEKARIQAALKNALEQVNTNSREEPVSGTGVLSRRPAGLSPAEQMEKLKREAEDGILLKLRKRLKS